jgi:hypothetical protein
VRRLTVAILAAVVVALAPGSARADGPTAGESFDTREGKKVEAASVDVASGPQGVTIYIAMSGTSAGQPAAEGVVQTEDRSEPACTATVTNIGHASVGWVREGAAQNPDSMPWFVRCDNGYAGIVWVPNDAGDEPTVVVTDGSPGVDPAVFAASLVDLIPLPPISIRVNPDVGLVAMQSWFWVEGYDGTPLRASRSLGPVTVEVELIPESYRWRFGDGSSLETSSLGRPYPEQSDVSHTYESSSLTAGGAYEVVVEITLDARYRVNGGPWLPLDPIVRLFSSDYPVRQLQAVLSSG